MLFMLLGVSKLSSRLLTRKKTNASIISKKIMAFENWYKKKKKMKKQVEKNK